MTTKLSHVAALLRLGWLEPRSLPSFAVELLLEGVESKSLIVLAGENHRCDPLELRDYLEAALQELSIAFPTQLEAARMLMIQTARDVVSTVVPANAGAARVVELRDATEHNLPAGGPHLGCDFGVSELISLYYTYDDADHRPDHVRVAEVARIDLEIEHWFERIVAHHA